VFRVLSRNEFYDGWLAYIFGEPTRPEGDAASSAEADGWDMAADTPPLRQVRALFQAERSHGHVEISSSQPTLKGDPNAPDSHR
jgi:hypothetical protein